VALDFFWEEGLGGETFLLFRGSVSSLDGVTSPSFYSSLVPFMSSTSSSPPHSSDTEEVFPEALLNSCTSIVFFILLGLDVSCAVSGLSGLDNIHRVC
jgi:hypothetical protein